MLEPRDDLYLHILIKSHYRTHNSYVISEILVVQEVDQSHLLLHMLAISLDMETGIFNYPARFGAGGNQTYCWPRKPSWHHPVFSWTMHSQVKSTTTK